MLARSRYLVASGLTALILGVGSAGAEDRFGYAPPTTKLENLGQVKGLYGFGVVANKDVKASLRKLMGRGLEDLEGVMQVTGPVDVIGGRFVYAQGCRAHSCGDTVGIVVVDTYAKKTYAAMIDEGAKRAWPRPIRNWPAEVQDVVRRQESSPAGSVF